MWAKIITIKRTKDLNYFSLCALNLFNTRVSQFDLNYWNKWAFHDILIYWDKPVDTYTHTRTEQNYKRNELNSKIKDFFYIHKRPVSLKYCSQICVSEHFSFAKIIHPPHRCGISRCWLERIIIAQVCLRLATIKCQSKMWMRHIESLRSLSSVHEKWGQK